VYRYKFGVTHGSAEADAWLASRDAMLVSAYAASLQRAQELHVQTLGFSLLSAGVFRGQKPLYDVLSIGLRAVRQHAHRGLRHVCLVAFTDDEEKELVKAFADVFDCRRGSGGNPASTVVVAPAGASESSASSSSTGSSSSMPTPVMRRPPPSVDCVADRLYVASFSAPCGRSSAALRALGVTHVINCAYELPCKWRHDFAYLHIKARHETHQWMVPA
jgi:hypothetical protein